MTIASNTVYLIDDEVNVIESLREGLLKENFKVLAFSDPMEALNQIKKEPAAVVVTDIIMPTLDGVDLIKKVKRISPETSFVIMTAHASLDTAIEALRVGAVDYLIKPFRLGELTSSIQKAMSQIRLVPTSVSQSAMEDRYRIKNLISSDPRMIEMFQMVAKIAKTDATVLITGESGTGKEMMARSIHYNSKRKQGPFISVNCAALPETLLESELFGYERGAFTGANTSKQGLFEVANSGTFFMDEIGEIPLSLQAKLLRVIQERTITHLGGVKENRVDIRLVAATSRNLEQEIKQGRFREDLYYRLNVVPIAMPPLRDRPNDISILAKHFIKYYSDKHQDKKNYQFTEDAFVHLKNYRWPGNIRELENLMERIVTVAESENITAKSIEKLLNIKSTSAVPHTSPGSVGGQIDLTHVVDEYEKKLIQDALKRTKGNKVEAASSLGITKQNLQYKLKKYGMDE